MPKYKSKHIINENSIKKGQKISSLKNKIIHGETLKTLQKIPSESIDLIITSPSYFLGKKYEKDQEFTEYLNAPFKLSPFKTTALNLSSKFLNSGELNLM